MTRSNPVLYCDCGGCDIIPEATRRRVLAALRRCGRPVLAVRDLCGCAARRDARLSQVAAAESATVVACYPRAVRWLFDWAGSPLDAARVQCLNMRTQSADEILDHIGKRPSCDASPDRQVIPENGNDASWRPWFPVIDYGRCVNCRQCVEFCLFAVYGEDDAGTVRVMNPTRCKNNCPACARMCPHVAIMFPKLQEDSPIAGSDADPGSAVGLVRLSREELFEGNALDKLRMRRNRPSLLRNKTSRERHDPSTDTADDSRDR